MKVVLDEGIPRHLVPALRRDGIDTYRFDKTWAGLTNGDLLSAVERAGYDVLLTNDKNMASQQSLAGRSIAVIALPHNKRRTMLERVPDIVDKLAYAQPGAHIVMALDGTRISRLARQGGQETRELPALKPFDP